MRPLTIIERLLWLLSPFRWIQCKAELPCYRGVAYCIRHKYHPGRHRAHNGERFDDISRPLEKP